MIIHHGGCLGCLEQDKYGLDYCKGCQYMALNWELPNLSTPKRESTIGTKLMLALAEYIDGDQPNTEREKWDSAYDRLLREFYSASHQELMTENAELMRMLMTENAELKRKIKAIQGVLNATATL